MWLSSTKVSNWCFNKPGNRDMSLVLLNTAVQMASTNPGPLGSFPPNFLRSFFFKTCTSSDFSYSLLLSCLGSIKAYVWSSSEFDIKEVDAQDDVEDGDTMTVG